MSRTNNYSNCLCWGLDLAFPCLITSKDGHHLKTSDPQTFGRFSTKVPAELMVTRLV